MGTVHCTIPAVAMATSAPYHRLGDGVPERPACAWLSVGPLRPVTPSVVKVADVKK